MSEQPQPKRMRPPPKRGRPGSKRPRTVIDLDDITTVAPPEAAAERISPQNSNQSENNNDQSENDGNEIASNNSMPTQTNVPHSFDQTKEPQKTTTTVSDPMSDSSSDSEEEQEEDKDQWWTLRENQHRLEGWVMDKLDKMITKAEREEERSLMNYFDEQILMQQLLHNIPKTSQSNNNDEDENCNHESKDAEGMEVESDSNRLEGGNSSKESSLEALRMASAIHHAEKDDSHRAETHSLESKINTPPSIELPATSETPVHVETDEQSTPTIIRRALPKWIPKSPYTDTATISERLFTPQEFDTCVIQTVINKLPQGTCQIHLMEDFPGDSDSYLLEARIFGKENAESTLDQLQKTTEAFVRSRIAGVNLRWLLEDGASLELQVSLNIKKSLGMRFSNFRLKDGTGTRDASHLKKESPPGLWINRVLPNEGLANALGSHTAFDHGCALLSMEGSVIQDPLVLKNVLQNLKKNLPVEKTSSVSFTICVSRHADLRAIPLSKLLRTHNIKRRDGKPIDVDLYPGLANDVETESNIPEAASAPNDVEKEDLPSPKASKKQKESNISSKAVSTENVVEKEGHPSPKVPKKQKASNVPTREASTPTAAEKEDHPSRKVSKKQKVSKIPSKPAPTPNAVNDDRPSPKASKKQKESNVPIREASTPTAAEKEDHPSRKVSKKQKVSKIPSKQAPTPNAVNDDRPSPKAAKKQKASNVPSREASPQKAIEKEDRPSPKLSKTLVHPSFPQHLLDHPSFSEHPQTPDKSKAAAKSITVHESRSPQSSKALVHPCFLNLFERLRGSKTTENEEKKSSDNHSQSPQASKAIVHPSFLDLFERLTRAETSEEEDEKKSGDHSLSPQISKEVVNPSSPQNLQESKESGESLLSSPGENQSADKTASKSNGATDAPSLPNKSSSDMSMSSASDTSSPPRVTSDAENQSADKTASKSNGATDAPSLPNKSSSDMSMSSASDTSSPPRVTSDAKPGSKVSNESAKNSQLSEPASDNRNPSKTSEENTDASTLGSITAEMNSGMERDEDKPVQKPASNTLLADSVSAPIGTSTSATDNGPPKKSEKTVGKESLPNPMSDGGKDKNTEESSQNRAVSKNSTAARMENDKRANIIRKRSLSHDTSQSSRQKGTNDYPTPPSNKRRRSLSGGINDYPVSPSHKRKSTFSRCDPYEVALDTRRPLGGFFRNERGQNFHSKCVISSICPGGQLSVDARIKIGTQVTATMVGERRVDIEDYNHLKDRYSDAENHRKSIRLILQNSFSCRTEPIHLSRNYWSSSGSWLGSMSAGWPGGASVENAWNGHGSRFRRDTVAHAGTSGSRLPLHERLEQERQRRLRAERNDMDAAARAGRLPLWQRLEKDRQRILQDEELEAKKKQREASFSGSFSHRNHSQETPSLEKPMSPTKGSFSPIDTIEDTERPPNSPIMSGERSVLDAIRNKAWQDLLYALERGPDFTQEFVRHVLKNQYSYLDDELKKANSSSSGTGTGGFQLALWERLEQERKKRLEEERQAERNEDLEAKKQILKLHINCAYLIQKADSLRNWTEVMIQIKSLHLYRLPLRTDTRRSEVLSATVRKIHPNVDLCNLPTTRIGLRISYSTNNEFSIHNNYRASLENRKIVVEISEGDPKVDKIHCNKLGQFVLTMNEIESKCPPDGSWHTMEHKLEHVGTIAFIAKRKSANKDYIINKRQEILEMLKTELETIEQFNSEYCSNPSSSVKLTPNIRGLHGTPLLYASIGVNADPQLIQKLISLGADPRKRHIDRSALDLARDQYERCKNKEKDASESRDQQVRQACAQKTSEAKRLLDILEGVR